LEVWEDEGGAIAGTRPSYQAVMRNGASGWARSVRAVVVDHSPLEIQETYMSKGMDRKKDTKKKPAKTLMEKRAAKKQKKASKPFQL